jgi:hypothetical protein
MDWRISAGHPLARLFQGTVEQVFQSEVGLCDPRLTDYLGGMLLEFVHMDRIYALRTVDGGVIREVSRFEADAYLGEGVSGTVRTRVINRFIGDFTLFWAGVYPEALQPRNAGADRLREFLLQGKRSYGIASELSESDTYPPGDLLRALSIEFEACVHGLNLVRAAWHAHAQLNRPN